MQKCNDECSPACDFCIYYEFNGDEDGAYTGNGHCVKHEIQSDPGYYCEDFHCFNLLKI